MARLPVLPLLLVTQRFATCTCKVPSCSNISTSCANRARMCTCALMPTTIPTSPFKVVKITLPCTCRKLLHTAVAGRCRLAVALCSPHIPHDHTKGRQSARKASVTLQHVCVAGTMLVPLPRRPIASHTSLHSSPSVYSYCYVSQIPCPLALAYGANGAFRHLATTALLGPLPANSLHSHKHTWLLPLGAPSSSCCSQASSTPLCHAYAPRSLLLSDYRTLGISSLMKLFPLPI